MDHHARAGNEDEHASGLGPAGAAIHRAVEHVEGPLRVLDGKGEGGAGRHDDVDVEGRRERLHRGSHAERRAGEHLQADSRLLTLRQARRPPVMERRLVVFGGLGGGDPDAEARGGGAAGGGGRGAGGPPCRCSGAVRSEWTIPRPAVIQLMSPGRIAWNEPRLSRWTICPSNRYVTVARPMCGCGGTSSPSPASNDGEPTLR